PRPALPPITPPPAASAALAGIPMTPMLPPPNTSPIPRAASRRPSVVAAAAYSAFAPRLEPANRQTRRITTRAAAAAGAHRSPADRHGLPPAAPPRPTARRPAATPPP